VKASTAEYTAEELITKRPVVKDTIEKLLKERLTNYGIIVESVYITDFKFSPEFETAIEAKVVAQQSALQAENLLKQKKVEAEQMIATAEGQAKSKILTATAEATAIRLQGEALKDNPGVIQLRAITAWNGLMPQYLILGNGQDSGIAGLILNMPTPSTTGG
jgi:regulator of protease activity HflC (stomatin/prohibitin superfamily)